MQYQKPGFIMKFASAEFTNENAGVNYLLKVREESNRWLLRHLGATPSSVQIHEANAFVKTISGVTLNEQQFREILSLFPVVRIELAVHGVGNLETQDNLLDALSNFFLGCTWPRMGDNVDMQRFLSLLRSQALAMGYDTSEARAGFSVPHLLGSVF